MGKDREPEPNIRKVTGGEYPKIFQPLVLEAGVEVAVFPNPIINLPSALQLDKVNHGADIELIAVPLRVDGATGYTIVFNILETLYGSHGQEDRDKNNYSFGLSKINDQSPYRRGLDVHIDANERTQRLTGYTAEIVVGQESETRAYSVTIPPVTARKRQFRHSYYKPMDNLGYGLDLPLDPELLNTMRIKITPPIPERRTITTSS